MRQYCDGNGANSCISRQRQHVKHEVPSQLKLSAWAQELLIMLSAFELPPAHPG